MKHEKWWEGQSVLTDEEKIELMAKGNMISFCQEWLAIEVYIKHTMTYTKNYVRARNSYK